MPKRTKISSILALTLILTALLANCTPQTQNNYKSPITIALVQSEPVDAAAPGVQSAYSGVALAAKQMEAEWGIHVNVVPYTDLSDIETARQVAEEIAQSDAVAVIGHSSVETSRAAGEIYDREGIPVINYLPVTEQLTDEYPYYFNTTYTAESEAAYVANYLTSTKGAKTATVISTNDGYGQTLAEQFTNTFTGLGGRITIEDEISSHSDQELEAIVSRIVSANTETQNPGTIFLATDDETAARLVILMKRKGISYPIAGASNLSTPDFVAEINSQEEEGSSPGYFTDGILTTRAIIFDSANRYANQFRNDYQKAYNADPGDVPVNTYDATLVLFSALERSNIDPDDEIAAVRQKVYKALLAMDDSQNSVQGIIGPIYFEPSRNITRAARFGIYQNGRIVSANIQFEPILTPGEIKDIQEQISNGRIMTVDGDYVYRANVVYAGIDLLSIDEIDFKTSTYKLDFYLWFRYRPNDQDEKFKPDEFEFTNAEGDVTQVLIREEPNTDGTFLKTYHVSGLFKNQFQFYDYPFDKQDLIVEFRNQDADTSFIQYVVDQIGMRYENEDELLDNFRANGAFDSIYGWDEKAVLVTQDIFPTYSTFGSPENFDQNVATNYSLIKTDVEIQRDSLQYIIKSLLPLLLTLVLAYITFFLPLGHSERLAVGSTALLTTAFFHLSFADALPQIGYTVAMEYLFYASYVMSALIVLFETLSIRYEKRAEDTDEKSEKDRYNKRREKLNIIGRIVYPVIFFLVLMTGYFIYIGKIQLGPNDPEAVHLVDLIVEPDADSTEDVNASQPTVATGDEIKLTLSTWRPEDDEQIQILLDEFHKYAQESLGKNIVIEHSPVVSVNYDSILDVQLSRGEGPDLFYVRPFSVNGNIAKYLEPLNDLPLDANYDETMIVPWTDRVGKYYAVPYVGVVQGVYYNKTLFERYGLAVPTTWADFLKNLDVIKEQNPAMIPIANALNEKEDSEMYMSISANFLGGPDGRAQLMRTDGQAECFNGPRVTSTFNAIEDIKPYLPKNAGKMSSEASKELFFDRQAVMLFGGSWDLQKVSDNANFEWGVFAVPAPASKQTYVIFQPDIGIGLNKDSLYQDESRLFLEWMMTQDAVDLTAQNLNGFYPLNATTPSVNMGTDDQKFLDLVKQYPRDIRWMFVEISDEYPKADAIIRNDLNQIIVSSLTSQQAAQNLQDGLGEWYEPAQTCR